MIFNALSVNCELLQYAGYNGSKSRWWLSGLFNQVCAWFRVVHADLTFLLCAP